MNQWQHAQPDGIFAQGSPSHLNPSSMYGNIANPAQFDVNAAANFHQPGLANGNHTPTQPFPNHSFQPASVVPQKRGHDGSGMSASPPPAPPPPTSQASRSHTPSYPGFQNQQQPQHFPPGANPNPYSHLQQPGSNHATPSPTMQSQQFRPQPSRMSSNASPSPFPQQHPSFAAQISSATPPNHTQPAGMPQQGQMPSGFGQYAMNPNVTLQASTPGQQSANLNAMASQQRQYQMRLLQQQSALRQQNTGIMPPRSVAAQPNQAYNLAAQPQPGKAPNGQANPMLQAQQHAQQMKRTQFLQACAQYAAKQGRQFNPTPSVGGKTLDLYNLFSVVVSAGGSGPIDRNGQWQAVATRLGFPQAQFPSSAEEIKQIFAHSIASYERAWMAARVSQKHEQARQHAHQMAGLGPPNPQSTPNKPSMQPPRPQIQFSPQFTPGQQPQPQPHPDPVQANATPAAQNGASTPQHVVGPPGSLQSRRASSARRPEAMPPQPAPQGTTVPSPHPVQKVQQSPTARPEVAPASLKSEEPQSTNYEPNKRYIDSDGGYHTHTLYELGSQIARFAHVMPTVDEMGIIDTRAITLSLASGIHAEVRYALDTLAAVSTDSRVSFDLEKCDDLIDVIIDRAEEQTDALADKADEVSDSIDLPSYEDVLRGSRAEAEAVQDVPQYGTVAYDLDRAADKLIAITTILRNFSFFEHNHRLLTGAALIKWLSNTLRLLGTRHMLLRTFLNVQDFYKDVIVFLSNITQSLELPTRDDALHILHFLLAFTPQPTPTYTTSGGKLSFTPFVPTVHRYLPPAVDCLAKLLARQDPNRILYRSIFSSSSNSLAGPNEDSPVDLLTRAFALSISVLPDRSKGSLTNTTQLRIVEARKAYLTQGMLAADILTTLLPGVGSDIIARAWIESEDGWAASLLSLASLLSVDQPPRPTLSKQPPMAWDTESFKLITHRALGMMKRLAEKAGNGAAGSLIHGGAAAADATATINGETAGETADEDGDADGEVKSVKKYEGVPQGHAIIGAMMLGNIDKIALGLLCGLHDLAMQP